MPASLRSDYPINHLLAEGQSCFGLRGNFHRLTHTMEAETGHGQYIRSVLEQVPFEEQIHIAHQIEHLNKSHAVLGDLPEIKFVAQNDSWDEKSKFGYSNFKLYRKIPGEGWGPFDKEELLYESSLNLTTGNKTATDNDL